MLLSDQKDDFFSPNLRYKIFDQNFSWEYVRLEFVQPFLNILVYFFYLIYIFIKFTIYFTKRYAPDERIRIYLNLTHLFQEKDLIGSDI